LVFFNNSDPRLAARLIGPEVILGLGSLGVIKVGLVAHRYASKTADFGNSLSKSQFALVT
jgi:hypothetical protein